MNPLSLAVTFLLAVLTLVAGVGGQLAFRAPVTLMPPGSPPPTKDDKPYRARGHLRGFWPNRVREIMISGPAGTGKSRCILERLYLIAEKYPGARILICRKTRASMTQSTLVTFERDVVVGRPRWVTNQKRNVRTSYILPNESEIVIVGLDNPERTLSTDYDLIYVQEAREIVEGDWEVLMRALRSTIMPYRAIWGDTNPDGPGHWILERERRGSLTLIPTTHEDNPLLFDETTESWTTFGREYIETLDAMTGLRLQRLRYGRWVGGENVVYEDWDPLVHVLEPGFTPPASWPRDLTVDFGYANAFCALWSAEDPDGRIYFFKELYGTHRTTVEWAHLICEHGGAENALLRAVITDHDHEARADLEKHMGHRADECPDLAQTKKTRAWVPVTVGTTPAVKGLEMRGIQAVQARLQRVKASDGKLYPRLFIVKNMRVNERDARLVEQKAPTCLEEEFPRYQWARARSLTAGEVLLERPVDKWNHGLDAVRYRVMHSDADLFPLSKVYGQSMPESIGG
jgi:hypothetical protein